MKKIIVLICITSSLCFGQAYKGWQGYFSYNSIVDVSHSPTKIIAATQNATLSQDVNTNEIATFNTVDGLKSESISAIYYSPTTNFTFIGNTNGLLIIKKPDGKILTKRGILDEIPVSPLIKKINNFYEYNGTIYIATDYGISAFSLTTLEFGDTYYIGNSGQADKVYQTTVYNNQIYAATQYNGIKKALVTSTNLVDYNQWAVFDSGSWNGIITFQNQLIAMNTNTILYKHNGTVFTSLFSMGQTGLTIKENGTKFAVTTSNKTFVFGALTQVLAQINASQITPNVIFTSATAIDDFVYIGTTTEGLLKVQITNTMLYNFIMPNGPIRNNIFRIRKSPSKLWATYGGYDINLYPTPDYSQLPISFYTTDAGWDKIKYAQLLGALSLTDINYNPNNENDIYVSSYNNGLLHINNNAIALYNEVTSPPNSPQIQEAIAPSYYNIRINSTCFDKKGNLWMTNALVKKPLKCLKPNNQWATAFDFSNELQDTEHESYSKLIIDKNETKWIASTHATNGLIAYNENYANKTLKITAEESNLPFNWITALALDNKNQLWIGTSKGLRYIPNVNEFIDATEIQTKNIIIEEGNNAEELFFDQFISDIAVDGANRKWVALGNAGVYLVSSDGQETIYKFTKDNSPLPSNNINDIEIDGTTGEVFFATDKGLVSFKGTATAPSDDLSQAYVYPNPVRPEYNGTIKIAGLSNKANIKITDIEGNLVYETTSQGGTIEWDGTAFGKYKVASGVYMIFLSAEDGIDTNVKKIMIIR